MATPQKYKILDKTMKLAAELESRGDSVTGTGQAFAKKGVPGRHIFTRALNCLTLESVLVEVLCSPRSYEN